jgi:phosphoserine phosphatase
MAETRAYLRVLAGRREDVGEILTRTNGILAEDVGSERFITLFLGRIDPKTRGFVYASAGHPAGYLLNAQGDIKATLKRTGIPLGMKADTQFASAPEIILSPGDLVLLLTDGIEEASAPDGTLFGLARILDTVRSSRTMPAQHIVQTLYETVRAFAHNAPQVDDITAIVIKVS